MKATNPLSLFNPVIPAKAGIQRLTKGNRLKPIQNRER